MLQLRHFQKFYGRNKILDIPDWYLPPGGYWLQGDNGSGKTTFLRSIAGLTPFKGEISLNEHSLRKTPVAYRRAITWADAEPLYPGFLTGEELLAFYRDIQQPPAGQIDQLVSRFGIASWLPSRASTWSTGMAKKLSLLLAFIGRPSLMILDEPLITLDQPVIDILIDLLITYQQFNGVSFIFSSHQNPPKELLDVTKRLSIKNESIYLLD